LDIEFGLIDKQEGYRYEGRYT